EIRLQEWGLLASFPGQPVETKEKALEANVIQKSTFLLEKNECSHMVMCIRFKAELAEAIGQSTPDVINSRWQELTVKKSLLNNTVLEQRVVTIAQGTTPGFELLLRTKSGSFVKQRVFYRDGVLFQTILSCQKEQEIRSPDAERFLDSLRLE